MNQPVNPNFLSPLGFEFVLQRAPNVSFICQSVNLPTISVNEVIRPTPLLDTKVPSDKILFEPFTIRFKIDEDMVNYFEIFDWLVGMGAPDDTDQYKEFTGVTRKYPPAPEKNVYSDATLIVQTGAKAPNRKLFFKNIFPVSITVPEFDTTDTEVTEMTADATFSLESFRLDT